MVERAGKPAVSDTDSPDAQLKPDAQDETHLGFLTSYYADRVAEVQSAAQKLTKEASDSLWGALLCFGLSVAAALGALNLDGNDWWATVLVWVLWPVAFAFALFGFILFAVGVGEWSQRRDLMRELRTVERLAGIVSKDDSADYFDQLVAINLGNLGEYYRLVKSHANRSFVIAALASVSGFTLVLVGVGYAVLHENAEVVGFVSAGAGTVIEIVSAVFFVLYSKTVRQLKDYHDSLLDVQNVLLSLRMIEDIADPDVRARTVSEVVRSLIGAGAAGARAASSLQSRDDT